LGDWLTQAGFAVVSLVGLGAALACLRAGEGRTAAAAAPLERS
jgi:hypothetical protein